MQATDRDPAIVARLEYLRGEIRAERISMAEIVELQSLAGQIEDSDVELREWAGIPEFPDDEDPAEVEVEMTAEDREREDHRRLADEGFRSIRILDALLDAGSFDEIPIETLADLIDDPADGIEIDLDELDEDPDRAEMFREGIRSEWGLEPGDDAIDYLNAAALELFGRAEIRSGSPIELDEVVIVWGTGGPHYESRIESSGRVRSLAYGWFGSAEVDRYDSGFDGLFGYLAEIVEVDR